MDQLLSCRCGESGPAAGTQPSRHIHGVYGAFFTEFLTREKLADYVAAHGKDDRGSRHFYQRQFELTDGQEARLKAAVKECSTHNLQTVLDCVPKIKNAVGAAAFERLDEYVRTNMPQHLMHSSGEVSP